MMGRGQTPAYDTMTINGKVYPATEPLRVRRGERIRLRLVNASAEHTHVIRLAGHRLQVTHTDGNPLVRPVAVDAVPIAPSEQYDVQVVTSHPGAWFLSCLQPGHAAAGEQVLLVYDGHEDRRPDPPEAGVAGLDVLRYGLGQGRDVLPWVSGSERRFELVLSGGMMGRMSGPSTAGNTPGPIRCGSEPGTACGSTSRTTAWRRTRCTCTASRSGCGPSTACELPSRS
jgi:FtsP/CotA-like multicopper oxidase with cupredoxin domain